MRRILLVLFVVSALVLSFAPSVMADAILFPWLVKSQTVTSMISVVNLSEPDTILVPQQLHYEYWHKTSAGDNELQSCVKQDFLRDSSLNDLVTFDASGAINGGKPLFNDNSYNGNVTYTPDSFHNSAAPTPNRSFLIVDNNPDSNDDKWRASMYGEAMIIQLQQGGAWGYVAFNGSRGGASDYADNVPFFDTTDMQGEVMRSPQYNENVDYETTPTVILPLSTFKTKFFVTPANWSGQRTGTANSRIQLCIDPYPMNTSEYVDLGGAPSGTIKDPSCSNPGIFDNDEGEISGGGPVNVVCTGAIDLAKDPTLGNTLLTLGQIEYLTTGGRNAWTMVRSMHGTQGFTSGMPFPSASKADSIIGKLEYTEASITISGSTIPGAINNFTWIRNNTSNSGNSTDHGINDLWPTTN